MRGNGPATGPRTTARPRARTPPSSRTGVPPVSGTASPVTAVGRSTPGLPKGYGVINNTGRAGNQPDLRRVATNPTYCAPWPTRDKLGAARVPAELLGHATRQTRVEARYHFHHDAGRAHQAMDWLSMSGGTDENARAGGRPSHYPDHERSRPPRFPRGLRPDSVSDGDPRGVLVYARGRERSRVVDAGLARAAICASGERPGNRRQASAPFRDKPRSRRLVARPRRLVSSTAT